MDERWLEGDHDMVLTASGVGPSTSQNYLTADANSAGFSSARPRSGRQLERGSGHHRRTALAGSLVLGRPRARARGRRSVTLLRGVRSSPPGLLVFGLDRARRG